MSNLSIYIVGFVILIAGSASGAYLLGAPPEWIGIGALILLGIGVVSGVSRTRIREASEGDSHTNRVVIDDGD